MKAFNKICFTISTVFFLGIMSSFNMVDSKEMAPHGDGWMDIASALDRTLNDENPKKTIIDIYTTWCGWCKRLDKNTFQHPVVKKYMEENFYMVKLDGEHKSDITIGENTYKFVKSGRRGYHELAAALTGGQMSYPTIVFLDEQFKQLVVAPGYQTPRDMDAMLHYFAEDAHKNDKTWEQFSSSYRSKIKEEK